MIIEYWITRMPRQIIKHDGNVLLQSEVELASFMHVT